jgi:hypothetical protein
MKAINPALSHEEGAANMFLLDNRQYLPRHMLGQFLTNPEYPAVKLVARLKKLADVNPNLPKPLKENLQQFFNPPEEEQVAQGGLPLENLEEKEPGQEPGQERRLPGKVAPEQSEQEVLQDLGAHQPLPGSEHTSSQKSPRKAPGVPAQQQEEEPSGLPLDQEGQQPQSSEPS